MHRPVRVGRVRGRPGDAVHEGRVTEDQPHRALLLQHRVEQVRRALLRRPRAPGRTHEGTQGGAAGPGLAGVRVRKPRVLPQRPFHAPERHREGARRLREDVVESGEAREIVERLPGDVPDARRPETRRRQDRDVDGPGARARRRGFEARVAGGGAAGGRGACDHQTERRLLPARLRVHRRVPEDRVQRRRAAQRLRESARSARVRVVEPADGGREDAGHPLVLVVISGPLPSGLQRAAELHRRVEGRRPRGVERGGDRGGGGQGLPRGLAERRRAAAESPRHENLADGHPAVRARPFGSDRDTGKSRGRRAGPLGLRQLPLRGRVPRLRDVWLRPRQGRGGVPR
mmetsp:Transcript_34857/g.107895  ORF Transcript_34857/g.107895 Transcript_34857/m.107895 type:complete len:345 (-) Transcript_34857:33-1067(-)